MLAVLIAGRLWRWERMCLGHRVVHSFPVLHRQACCRCCSRRPTVSSSCAWAVAGLLSLENLAPSSWRVVDGAPTVFACARSTTQVRVPSSRQTRGQVGFFTFSSFCCMVSSFGNRVHTTLFGGTLHRYALCAIRAICSAPMGQRLHSCMLCCAMVVTAAPLQTLRAEPAYLHNDQRNQTG